MPKLLLISGKQSVKFFQNLGYKVVRQKGSHIRLHHPSNHNRFPLTIPKHKTLGKGLLRKLLRDAKISKEEFLDLLEK